MTDLADLAWYPPGPEPTPTGAKGRRCRRHEWRSPDGDDFCAKCGQPLLHRTHASNHEFMVAEHCGRCGAIRDPAASRRNRNNRKRGNRTSLDLAHYLGGRNVEALKEPWDVEACGARIQSKRLADRPSVNAMLGYLGAITGRTDLAAFYWVGPNRRVASGHIFVLVSDWVAEHGWRPPEGAVVHATGGYLLEMPVAVFRDVRGGSA